MDSQNDGKYTGATFASNWSILAQDGERRSTKSCSSHFQFYDESHCSAMIRIKDRRNTIMYKNLLRSTRAISERMEVRMLLKEIKHLRRG
jgi:hypothetical protein